MEITKEDDHGNGYNEAEHENTEYLRRLLKQKHPEFARALELAADLVERHLRSSQMPHHISTPVGSCPVA